MKETEATSLPLEWLPGAFSAFEKSLNGGATSVVHRLRKEAFTRVAELGVPSSKDEEWKHTNLSVFSRSPWLVAERKPADFLSYLHIQPFLLPENKASRLVFVDGYFSTELSSLMPQSGAEVVSGVTHGDALTESKLATLFHEGDSKDPLLSLNTSFFTDGAQIRIARGVHLEHPIELLFVATGARNNELISPRVAIVVEEGARAEVLESYISLGSGTYCTNTVTTVDVQTNAHFTHTKLQCEGDGAFHLGRLDVTVHPNSDFVSNLYHFGGKLVRNEIRPRLGKGCRCYLNGLTAIRGEQHVDNTTVIDHAEPDAFSRELYKGVYGDRARGVFSGTIIVRQDAQKTNAIQSNKSILLTDTASVDSRPQLKIWADDVKCTHGATVGQLDEHALFYLRSRGIPELTARNMLIHAFSSEIVHAVERLQTRNLLERLLLSKLGSHIA